MIVDIYHPVRKYSVIYADPPWEYKESGGGHRGTAGMSYPSMTTEEICSLPVNEIADTRSILFIWATFPRLKDCLKVMDAWGFSYYGLGFDWTKTGKNGKPCYGMGYYTRQNNEVCLIGVRKERLKPIDRSISCVIQSIRREHSRKPDEVRVAIERILGDVPRIELFARQEFPGWDCWGNQTDMFCEEGGSRGTDH